MAKIYPTILISFVLLLCTVFATKAAPQTPDTTHLAFEQTVNELMKSIDKSRQPASIQELAKQVDRMMDSLLANPEVMRYPFDSLKYIGSVISKDKALRIFTWNIPLGDGTYKYYGKVQYHPNNKTFKYLSLSDKSSAMENPQRQRLTPSQWYGALYYDLIAHTSGDQTYYTVLGLNLNDMLSNKKLIDVIWFDDQEQAHIGAPIFRNQAGRQYRIIFEYSSRVVMGLKYDERMQMIVYDHLAPFKPQLKGQYEFYGPDFSYDGFKLERGIWNAYSDLDARRFDMSGNNSD